MNVGGCGNMPMFSLDVHKGAYSFSRSRPDVTGAEVLKGAGRLLPPQVATGSSKEGFRPCMHSHWSLLTIPELITLESGLFEPLGLLISRVDRFV